MVRVKNFIGLPMGASIAVARPVILSNPRSIRIIGPLGVSGWLVAPTSGAFSSGVAGAGLTGAGLTGAGGVWATAAPAASSSVAANRAFMDRAAIAAAVWARARRVGRPCRRQ